MLMQRPWHSSANAEAMGLTSVEVPQFFFFWEGGQFAIAQIAITTATITMYGSWLGARYWCTRA